MRRAETGRTPTPTQERIDQQDLPGTDADASSAGPGTGESRPGRLWRRRGLRSGAGFCVVFVLAVLPSLAGANQYVLYVAALSLIYVLAAAGLNLAFGYAGLISLAQGAFMGVGAYTVAILTVKVGLSVWLGIAAAPVIGFGLGAAIGYPAIRVRLHYLAMLTLGAAEVFNLVVSNQQGLTGGNLGIYGIPAPSLFGIGLGGSASFETFVAVIVVLALAALYAILNGTWGRAFKAIRENEQRAAMLGVDVRAYKILAMAIGSALGALAGALMAPLLTYIDPSSFPITLAFQLLLMVVIGGTGRFEGPIIGAIVVTVLPEALRGTQSLYLIIFACIALAVILFLPDGLITAWDAAFLRLTGRRPPALTK